MASSLDRRGDAGGMLIPTETPKAMTGITRTTTTYLIPMWRMIRIANDDADESGPEPESTSPAEADATAVDAHLVGVFGTGWGSGGLRAGVMAGRGLEVGGRRRGCW